MFNIRAEQSFILYAKCDVKYYGRTKSFLERNNHLIIHKSDGTLIIHGDSLFKPLNYQPPKAMLRVDGNKLISIRNNESIEITIYEIIYYKELSDWSSNKIELYGSENDIKELIVKNINNYINIIGVYEIYREFVIPVGVIDILVINEKRYHVIEVKRDKAGLNACSQLDRYYNYFESLVGSENVYGYLASQNITANALKYINDNNHKWIKIDNIIK